MFSTKFLLLAAVQFLGVLSTPIAEASNNDALVARHVATITGFPSSTTCAQNSGGAFTWNISNGEASCYSYNGNTDMYSLHMEWSDGDQCGGDTGVLYLYHDDYNCGDFSSTTRLFGGANGNFCASNGGNSIKSFTFGCEGL
nr:hypothetical protein [Trichoderma psychrophilum]